jgi:DNA-directed RNA polymerase specialized sigma24 family protein
MALLGNHADAQDAVQETWVLALRRPPREPGQLDGWLHTLLRRVASNLRRGRARRLRREQSAARPESLPAADAALVQRETLRRVLDGLCALAEPFRGALWQRFFEHQKPAAIAARTGEPLATVKSRLQRGLAMVRERLDGNGSDWRGALAGAFGLERASAVASGAALSTGVLLMGSGVKLAIGAAAVLAVAATLYLTRGAPVVESIASPGSGVVAAATGADGVANGETQQPGAASNERKEVAEAATVGSDVAVIRGRCVDEAGQPLAACAVTLSSQSATLLEPAPEDRVALQRWRDPAPVHTGTDGKFMITFVPLRALAFHLSLDHPERVPLGASWPEIKPGSRIDLADVVMHRGMRVRGHVIDEQHRPVPEAFVTLAEAAGPQPGVLACAAISATTTNLEGEFTSSQSSGPGVFRAFVSAPDKLQVTSPATIELGSGGTLDVEITVMRHAERGEITGFVFDTNGQPVHRAGIQVHQGWAATTSASDGTFSLVRSPDSTREPVRLAAQAQGFERVETPETHAWGERGVRLVLTPATRHGTDLQIRVLTEGGQPVGDYEAELLRLTDRGELDGAMSARCRKASGVAEVQTAKSGHYKMVVVPSSAGCAMTSWIPFDVEGTATQTIEVRVPVARERVLHLQWADGSAVADSLVRLVDPVDARLEWFDVPVRPLHRNQGGLAGPILVQETSTDASGDARLVGPGDRPLDVMLLGPSHAAQVLHLVRLDTSDPLVITVRSGATVRGSLRPTGIIRELRLLAALAPDGDLHGNPRSRLPMVVMRRLVRGGMQAVPIAGTDRIVVNDDGTFLLTGLPDGAATISIVCTTGYVPNAGALTVPEASAEVRLHEGEISELNFDLSRLISGELVGTAVLNGKPMPGANFMLACDTLIGGSLAINTDNEGTFRLHGRPGTYHLEIIQAAGSRISSTDATVVSGQATTATFAFTTASLRVRIHDAQGTLKPGVQVELDEAAGHAQVLVGPTNDAGEAHALLPPGTWTAWTLPSRVQLGTQVTAIAGTDLVLDLSLPPDSPR